MKSIDLHNCTLGTVSSKEDGSVTFRVMTAELRGSEKSSVMDFHGKACRVAIFPHDTQIEETITVTTEKDAKTPSQRMRGVWFIAWKQGVDKREGETFDAFYIRQYEKLLDFWKAKLEP